MAAAKIILNTFGKINKLNIALVSQPIAKKKKRRNNHRVVYKCLQRKIIKIQVFLTLTDLCLKNQVHI